MTKKVLQIQGILNNNASTLAENMTATYNKWRIQKSSKEAEWKELQKYLFATDTTTTSNNQLPWRNSTTIPKLAQIRDNLHANYMDAIFPNEEWLIWDGDDADSVEAGKRRVIEEYVKNKAKLSGIRETMSDLIYDYIDYGNSFAEVIWVNESHRDPISGEEVSTYTGPKVRRISPFDHVFDPTAANYNESPKFTRYLKSIGELKKELKTRPDLKYDEKVFQEVVEMRKSLSQFKMEDWNKAEGYIADGFGSLSEYLGSGLVELIEFEGDWYDADNDILIENQIITIVDGNRILRQIDNPNWFGIDNKVHVGWRDRPDNLYAMGPLDNLVGMQYRLDHLENLKADALDLTILPPLEVKGDVEQFVWEPRAQIRISEDGGINPLAPNQAAFQVNNEIAFIMDTMEEMAGAPKQAAGIRTPGEKTAFEVQTLENNAGRIFHAKTSKFEVRGLEKIMNLFLESAKRNLDVKDIVKVVDDDFGVAEFLTITRDDITAKGKLRPMGARHFAARAQLMQNLNNIHGGAIGQMLNAHTSRKAMATLIEEKMGLTKYQLYKTNIGVMEDAETERLMQEARIQMQTEATTPLEENLGT